MDELKQAQKDFLTGFYSREHLISSLLKRIIDVNLHNGKFSVLLVDIDHLKKINSKYGHLWGDEILKYVASTLRLVLGDKGLIFRYGGDEFVVLFSTSEPSQAFSLARQFNTVMKKRPFLFNGHLFKITVSCGLVTYPGDAQGAEDLLEVADKALYFSKRYGRNTTTRASKIGVQKFKIISTVFLEVFFIAALVFFLNIYFLRSNLRNILESSVRGLLPLGAKADTSIVLKSGDVIFGHIVSEDYDSIVVRVSFDQGSCKMDIKKSLIQSLKSTRSKSK